ncbi:MmgE/PrpD family protein [Acidianus sulfidivorans JP7]|uniref:2-methylcitrate dehydratase n=1 Tax=Acidianus sulfidivorans JP7 TaxID=619593 RepID=A0A2U9IJV1_9CREN|nr:MmgE/PrpD family protein [Acidianus sulfidivorans]AWR96319.1 MmgE/PrpD family protein [Acidianus sulfidivorans JP7]
MELAEVISDYVTSINYNDLKDKEIHEAKRRIIDSIAVAKASLNSEPARITQKLFNYYSGNGLTLLGNTVAPDLASFYNTLVIRYLDFNDTYLSLEPLHPSDMIGGLFALGKGKKGKDLILSIIVGYEVGTRLCDSASLRKLGFDHVNFLQVAGAASLSKFLNLDKNKTYNAISISLIPHIALRQTRTGKLSMWKAGAAAEAMRNATFSVMLAMEGFTGPEKPFSGNMGFSKIITQLDLSKFENMGTSKILSTSMKKYPVEYHAEAAVEAALNIQYQGEIRKIYVETYEAAVSILADKEKWRPENKETADHSLPFIIASTLLYKNMWLENYSKINDDKIKELMDKIQVLENDEYSKVYPRELPIKLEIITDKGRFETEVRSPRGYYNNPMSDAEIEEKAMKLGLSKEKINELWNIENMEVEKIVT